MGHMDYIYQQEDYFKNVRQTSIFMGDLMEPHLNAVDEPTVLDLGCAQGEFVYYLAKRFGEGMSATGLDSSEALIETANAKANLPNLDFLVGDGESFSLGRSFRVITSVGVTGYFDSLDKFFKSISDHLVEGGRAFIMSLFNAYDIDVLVKYRMNGQFETFQPGWNMHSLKTAEKVFEAQGMKLEAAHEFKLPFEDPKKEDPARSWTIQTDEGQKFVNGLGQIYSMYALEASKQPG